MKKVKLFIASVVAAFSFAPVMVPALVHAQTGSSNDISGQVSCGSNLDLNTATGAGCAVTDTTDKVNNGIKLAIRIFQFVVGIISIVMIIIGGLKYITSGGDAGNIGTAKNTILYAIVGLVVVVLAQVIVQFVLSKSQAL